MPARGCRYYDLPTTVSMFIGNSQDYVDMYLAAAKGMLVSPHRLEFAVQCHTVLLIQALHRDL